MSEIQERRRFPRLSARVGVEYVVLDKIEAGHFDTESKNICAGGICIIAFENLKPQDILEVKFLIPKSGFLMRRQKHIITTKARVIWIDEFSKDYKEKGRAYKVGIEFIDISQSDKRAIQEYIQKKCK